MVSAFSNSTASSMKARGTENHSLATLPDGSTLIVDWKTGEHFEEHRGDYELQVALYMEACKPHQSIASTTTAWWVPLEGARAGLLRETNPFSAQIALVSALEKDPSPPDEAPDARCIGCPGATRLCPALRRPVKPGCPREIEPR